MKIVHISDTHIHTTAGHERHRAVLADCLNKIKQINPNIIVHTGDVFHNHLQLSAESLMLAHDTLRSWAAIAPVVVLAGNHDGWVTASERMTTVQPLTTLTRGENKIYYADNAYDETGTFRVNNITFGVFSRYDNPDDWPIRVADDGRIHIALYHGKIGSLLLDGGIAMGNSCVLRGDHLPLTKFAEYDFGMFGDIHEAQALDRDGRFRYAGSLLQTRQGESHPKGFLLWDIQNADDFSVEFVPVADPQPYAKIVVEADWTPATAKKKIKQRMSEIPENSVLSIEIKSTQISQVEAEELAQWIAEKTEAAQFTWKRDQKALARGAAVEVIAADPDAAVDPSMWMTCEGQVALLKGQLANKLGIENSDLVERVCDLHRRYYAETATQAQDQKPTGVWRIGKLQWENFFSYAEGEFDFADTENRLVGVFGENASGKSSIMDILAIALYGRCPREHQIGRCIHDQADDASVEVFVEAKDMNMLITRRYKRDSRDTVSQTVTLVSSVEGKEQRISGAKAVQPIINKTLGAYDDWLSQGYSDQFGALRGLSLGGTDRLAMLRSACDLDFLDSMVKQANMERLARERSMIQNPTDDIQRAKDAIVSAEEIIASMADELATLRVDVEQAQAKVTQKEVEKQAIALATGVEDVAVLQQKITSVEAEIPQYEQKITRAKDKITQIKQRKIEIENELNEFDAKKLKREIALLENERRTLVEKRTEMNVLQRELSKEDSEAGRVDEIPCKGMDIMYQCPYVLDLVSRLEERQNRESAIQVLFGECKDSEAIIKNSEKSKQLLDEYLLLDNEMKSADSEQRSLETNIANWKTIIKQNQERLEELREKLALSESQKDILATRGRITVEIAERKQVLREAQAALAAAEEAARKAERTLGVSETQLAAAQQKYEEWVKQTDELEALKVYVKATDGKTGIPAEIIRRLLPGINEQMRSMTAGITPFTVELANTDKDSIDIFLVYEDCRRPIAMGSGMEKQIAAIALRMAMYDITRLARPNVMILDEPATALSPKMQIAFGQVMSILQARFEKIFIITHLDAIRDIVDEAWLVEKIKGFSTLRKVD